ncbi:MAG: HlyD family efflux transporter periplasmic adaptor subunit [Desulfovibrio sp.]|nr:HlyD family efflux transporter periplasmic adaptor subunit [Desulfovibrio sp.]
MKTAIPLLCTLYLLLAACGDTDRSGFQGYVEGEYVYLAPSRAGRLEALHVRRGEDITADVLLFALEAAPERHALSEATEAVLQAEAELADMVTGRRPEEISMAEAQLSQARAEAANARATLRRNENLVRDGAVSRRELDDSRAAALATSARVAELVSQVAVYQLPARQKKIEAQQAIIRAAQARAAQAQWEFDQKEMRAPTAGLICDTLYRIGEWVPAGHPVIQLLPPENILVRFFVPESLLGGIRTGQRVLCRIDGVQDEVALTITYIAPEAEYTPPVIYSNETRSKLVFMLEACAEGPLTVQLHPGQPVSVRLP